MYLNVIPPPPAPLPNVNGLGQFRMVHPRRGIGQAASSCAAYLAQQLAALPPASTAAMLLNTGSPSMAVLGALYINGASSPAEAAQVVYSLAAEFCGQQQDTIVFGGTPPADCSDNGQAAAAAAYPAWLAYYSSLPASVWTTGTVSAQVANPHAFPSAGSAGPSSAGIMRSGGGGNAPVSATLSNASRPGQSFQVGDQFQLVITGPANAQVTETQATQNGAVVGSSWNAGQTDSTGKLVITNTFGSGDIGTWAETWSVMGGGNMPTLNFTVNAAPSSGGGGGGGSQSGGGGGSQQSGGGGTQQTGGTASTSAALPSWLTGDIAGIPIWGWGLGALALLFVIPRGR